MDRSAPQQSSGAFLIDLGSDILLMIVDLLSTNDIKSLRLANSKLTYAAKYGLHREIKIKCRRVDFNQVQARFSTMQAEGLLQAVQRFEVNGLRVPNYRRKRPHRSTYDNRQVQLICWCLSHMSGLKDFLLQGSSLPADVLTTLQTRPEVRFSMSAVDMEKPKQLSALKNNQQLHSLEVRHTYITAEECLRITKPLRQVLLNCSNIRKLKLDIAIRSVDPRAHRTPIEYHGMGLRNGEKPAPLEELEIVHYPFGSTNSAQLYSFQGYPERIDEDEYWAEVFDWSRLRKLRAPMCPLVTKLLPITHALEELELPRTDWGPPGTLPMFKELPATLRSIEIDRIRPIGWQGVIKHGASLQRLKVHQNEKHRDTWNDRVMIEEVVYWDKLMQDPYLVKFQHHCPLIEQLSIDMGRDGDWPYETLDILAGFPLLRTLELWFALGIKHPEAPVQPYVTFAAAGKLFRYLHIRNPNIKQLVVHSGVSPDTFWNGLPRRHEYWPHNNTATFKCNLAAIEEEADQGIFVTTCNRIRNDENEMLRRVLARHPAGDVTLDDAVDELGDDWGSVEAERKRLCRVAWEGPAAFVPFDTDADFNL